MSYQMYVLDGIWYSKEIKHDGIKYSWTGKYKNIPR